MDSSSENDSAISEIDEEQIFDEDITSKEIHGGNGDIRFNSKAEEIKINNGEHTIYINNHIENLQIFGGQNELHIKDSIDNLVILGGKSTIYVYDKKNIKVYKFYIKGGLHSIDILSYVHKIEIVGGIVTIKCNYSNSKIDKIIAIGGVKNITFNKITNKCQKNFKGGESNLNCTDIVKEIPKSILYSDKVISPSNILDNKKTELCSICVDDFVKNNKAYILPCKHFFHIVCLSKWFQGKKNRVCPNCKFKVISKLKET